jgi:hypothetical protein
MRGGFLVCINPSMNRGVAGLDPNRNRFQRFHRFSEEFCLTSDAFRLKSVMLEWMKEKNRTRSQPIADLKPLQAVRAPLLVLHKALVESERVEYEKTIGRIQSPNHFLQLLTNDPWFAWLSPLSQLIVSIDEALDSKEPVTAVAVKALMDEVTRLLTPCESGDGFGKHYFEAMQRDPDVVLAHGAVVKLRGPRKPSGSS